MYTVPYKGQHWPVTDAWAEKHLAGAFAELVTWATGSQQEDDGVGLWGRLWAILRKSDETLAQRTSGMSHEQIRERMESDPEFVKEILETLSPEELRELRALEAHIIVRNRVDHLLGRDLVEFDIHYIDHAHGQGHGYLCGCELLAVLDDDKLARAQAGEEGLQFLHPHYPRRLCGHHAHLHSVVVGAGRWHNQTLSDRLAYVHQTVLDDNCTEAQPDEAAAA